MLLWEETNDKKEFANIHKNLAITTKITHTERYLHQKTNRHSSDTNKFGSPCVKPLRWVLGCAGSAATRTHTHTHTSQAELTDGSEGIPRGEGTTLASRWTQGALQTPLENTAVRGQEYIRAMKHSSKRASLCFLIRFSVVVAHEQDSACLNAFITRKLCSK